MKIIDSAKNRAKELTLEIPRLKKSMESLRIKLHDSIAELEVCESIIIGKKKTGTQAGGHGSTKTDGITIKWKTLIIDLLRNQKRLMASTEILDTIFPNLKKDERQLYMRNMSSSINGFVKNGGLKKFEFKGRGFRYGTPEMFSGEIPKAEFIKESS